jgi:hypothetical protein
MKTLYVYFGQYLAGGTYLLQLGTHTQRVVLQ